MTDPHAPPRDTSVEQMVEGQPEDRHRKDHGPRRLPRPTVSRRGHRRQPVRRRQGGARTSAARRTPGACAREGRSRRSSRRWHGRGGGPRTHACTTRCATFGKPTESLARRRESSSGKRGETPEMIPSVTAGGASGILRTTSCSDTSTTARSSRPEGSSSSSVISERQLSLRRAMPTRT